jgi:hypothetical protein
VVDVLTTEELSDRTPVPYSVVFDLAGPVEAAGVTARLQRLPR